MKQYKRLANTNAIRTIDTIVDLHNDMKGSYFWTPPGSASRRRSYEADRCNDLTFRFDGNTYRIEQTTSCSCKHIRYQLYVEVDGKRKDVRVLKRLLALHG